MTLFPLQVALLTIAENDLKSHDKITLGLKHIGRSFLLVFNTFLFFCIFSERFPVIYGFSIDINIRIHHHFSFFSECWLVGPLQLSMGPFITTFFLPGWSKVVKFYFAQSKQTKQPFLAKSFIHKCQISNCKRGHSPPAPTPFQTPMDITIGKTSVSRRQNYFGTLKQEAVEMLIAKLCNVLYRK